MKSVKPRRRYRLLQGQLVRIGADARALARSRRREMAGVLVERDGLAQLVPSPNVSRRRGSFEIRRSEIRRVDRAARQLSAKVVGTFHSHVVSETRPSPRDLREAEGGSLMLIYDTIDREWRLWRMRGARGYRLKFGAV